MSITIPTNGYIVLADFLDSYFVTFNLVSNRNISDAGIERIITAKFGELNGLLAQRGIPLPTSSVDVRIISALAHMNAVGASTFVLMVLKSSIAEDMSNTLYHSYIAQWNDIKKDIMEGMYDVQLLAPSVVTNQNDFVDEEGNLGGKDWSL